MEKKFNVLQSANSKSGVGDFELLKSFKNLEEAKEFYNVAKFDIEGYELKNKVLATILCDEKNNILESFNLDLKNLKIKLVLVTDEFIKVNIFDKEIILKSSIDEIEDINDIDDLIKKNSFKFLEFGKCKELIKIKLLKILDDALL